MQQIGQYQVLGEVGRGAMGVVYRAIDPTIGRTVALKIVNLNEFSDKQEREWLRERLMREARSAGILRHPNIVTIYQMAEEGTLAYIVMEFVNGPTLEDMLSRDDLPPRETFLELLCQIATALDYAHRKGVVHRDIKPSNIMVDEDGTAKIADFGIAKIFEGQRSQTMHGTMMGSPYYMSPEQVQGSTTVDGRSDQFSLAVIAYRMLTGQRPLHAESMATLLYKIIYEPPRPARDWNNSLTDQIDAVLMRGMAKDREMRFGSCCEFLAELRAACEASPMWQPGRAAGWAGGPPNDATAVALKRTFDPSASANRRSTTGPHTAGPPSAVVTPPPQPVYVPPPPGEGSAPKHPNKNAGRAMGAGITVAILALLGILAYVLMSPGQPLLIETQQLQTAQVGVAYTESLAAKGGKAPYRWASVEGRLPAGIRLEGDGKLAGTPGRDGDFIFKARVIDGRENTAEREFHLPVDPAGAPTVTLLIRTDSLPEAKLNAAYDAPLSASGNKGALRWSLLRGKLPAGLTLEEGGRVRGRPGQEGIFDVGIRVADASGHVTDRDFRLVVQGSERRIVPMEIRTDSLADGRVGERYAQALRVVGGEPPYRWSSSGGSLPAGITLSSSGHVSGTPVEAKESRFRARVTDNAGQTTDREFRLNIAAVIPPPPPPVKDKDKDTPRKVDLTRGCFEPKTYPGALEGVLTWSGSLAPGERVTIEKGSVVEGSGTAKGRFPCVSGLVVRIAPSPAVMVEPPAAGNFFERIVVRNSSSAPLNSFRVTWQVPDQ